MSAQLLLAEISNTILLGLGFVAILFVLFVQAAVWASRFVRVGPNQVLVISGRRYQHPDGTTTGFRLVKGGGTFVWPVIEKLDVLSLEVVTLPLQMPQIHTASGAAVSVTGEVQFKISGEEAFLRRAAECFLSSPMPGAQPAANQSPIAKVVLATLEKHLGALLADPSGTDLLRHPPTLAMRWQDRTQPDLARMGLEILNLVVRGVSQPPPPLP